ncbi:MAG TPA: PepSY-like domain-containing protein [Planctomycetota bacterium]|jgi:hypothetical protein
MNKIRVLLLALLLVGGLQATDAPLNPPPETLLPPPPPPPMDMMPALPDISTLLQGVASTMPMMSGITPVNPADLPAAVASAVQTAAPGATIIAAAKMDGMPTIYAVVARTPDTTYGFAIAADGTILKKMQQSISTVTPTDLPQAVKDAVQKLAPGATIVGAIKRNDGTQDVYDIAATTATLKFGFAIAADGTVLKFAGGGPIAPADLPKAVADAIAAKAPGATIVNAGVFMDLSGTTYTIQAKSADTMYGLVIAADGTVLKSWQDTHAAVDPVTLPQAVIDAVKKAAPDATIQAAMKNSDGTTTVYNVCAASATTKYAFVIAEDGTILKSMSNGSASPTDLPQAVLDTIHAKAPSATIVGAQETDLNGKVAYNVFAQDAASHYGFVVAEDGTLIKFWQETQIAPADIPAAVTAAIQTAFSGATITGAMMHMDGDKTAFGVMLTTADGKPAKLMVDSSGAILGGVNTAEDIAPQDLPKAVTDAVAAAAPGATITGAQKVSNGTMTAYIVSIQNGSKTGKLVVSEDGKILKGWSCPPPPSDKQPANQPPPKQAGNKEVTALPQEILDAVTKALPDGVVVKVIQGLKKKLAIFKIEALTPDKDVNLVVDSAGKVLSQRAKKLRNR